VFFKAEQAASEDKAVFMFNDPLSALLRGEGGRRTFTTALRRLTMEAFAPHR
jgi:hypothetical protein